MTEITKTKRVSQQVLEDVICNRCDKSCKSGDDFEYLHGSVNWGFGSGMDLTHWEFDLCEKCSLQLKEWIEATGGKLGITNYSLCE